MIEIMCPRCERRVESAERLVQELQERLKRKEEMYESFKSVATLLSLGEAKAFGHGCLGAVQMNDPLAAALTQIGAFDEAECKRFIHIQTKEIADVLTMAARWENARLAPLLAALIQVASSAAIFVDPKTLDWRESSDNHDSLTEALARLEALASGNKTEEV